MGVCGRLGVRRCAVPAQPLRPCVCVCVCVGAWVPAQPLIHSKTQFALFAFLPSVDVRACVVRARGRRCAPCVLGDSEAYKEQPACARVGGVAPV